MIQVITAVKCATDFLSEVYDTKEVVGILLEEVELSEDSSFWLVSVGSSRPVPSDGFMENMVKKEYTREVKTLKLNAQNGDVISMTNYNQ